MIRPEYNEIQSGSGYVIGEITKAPKGLRYLQEGELCSFFDGVDTALDYITKLQPMKGKTSAGYEPGFQVFQTFNQAIDVFRNHPEQVVDFIPAELRIKDASESGQEVDYDVVGDYIDMGRYMEGIPESWGSMHMGNARNRRINITVHSNYNGGTGEDIVRHRSERIIRLIDALEAGGVRVKLTVMWSNECAHTELLVKKHEEPLTIADVAVVTHPDWHRRLQFRLVENSKTFEYGYGRSDLFTKNATPEMLEDEQLNDETGIFIGNTLHSRGIIDTRFDQLEKLLQWEMSKPIPEVTSIKVDGRSIDFNPNGARSDDEIIREGKEIINGD